MRHRSTPVPRRRAGRRVTAAGVAVVALAGAVAWLPGSARGASVACGVDYQVASQWPGGFTANVTITDLGDPLDGWHLAWSFDDGQRITQAWGGSYTQSGADVTVASASWNGTVATGETATFGFNGTYTDTNGVPDGFTLNGVACTGTGAPPTSEPPTTTPPTSEPPTTQPPSSSGRQMEKLDRGLISVPRDDGNLVSWRLLGTDPTDIAFNLYRGSTKLNSSPITGATDYVDSGAPADATYTVRPVIDGQERAASKTSLTFGSGGYFDVPIDPPSGGTTPDGVSYSYTANDVSVGDLNGDGRYELVLKWDPTNSKDNSQSGDTGDVYVDAYTLTGDRLWRIDLGRNIRAGAHYTQFQVYDYDGDGKAEVAMKTADATVDGTGQVIGDASADYRNSDGYILDGPEYLTMFNGQTGAAMQTVDYVPPRGDVCSWGDCYGNRVDRFLAGTAYVDGHRPSLIEARGYYTRTVVSAWNWRDGHFTRLWTFDSNSSTNGPSWEGQGNHQLSVADVDGDGKDEIVYGAMAIDDDGSGLWNTEFGHGDAMDVGDLDPSRPGLEEFKVDEDHSSPAAWFADASDGSVIWQIPSCDCDNGRGRSDDIWAGSPGAESWSAATDGIYDTEGDQVTDHTPSSDNFTVWWDGDPVRELLDHTHIDKYHPSGDQRLLTAQGVHSNNGTKANPSLSADILGDWREEVVWPTSDDRALRIYATPDHTDRRLVTLIHDSMYREGVAWQNTAYNQPPHPSFFLGAGMTTPPRPNIYTP